jgi:opacity protein-like surface antigen
MVYQGFYDRNIMAMASAEYAYYDFGKKQVEFSDGELVDNKIIFQGFTLGLSWKF